MRAIVRDLLESNVEKRRFKRLALGLTVLAALALTALVVLGVVIISLLRDYDKEETDENLPAVQMNGNIVGTRAVTTTLPLLAATAMGMARLEQASRTSASCPHHLAVAPSPLPTPIARPSGEVGSRVHLGLR